MLGTEGISDYAAQSSYDYIYYGTWEAPDEYTTSGPIKWRVLDADQGNAVGAADSLKDAGGTQVENADAMFLLSEELLGSEASGGVAFGSYDNNTWYGSSAWGWCGTFMGAWTGADVSQAFTEKEQAALLTTIKTDEEFVSSGSYTYSRVENILRGNLWGDKVFFLSAEEAEKEAYGFVGDESRVAYYNGTAKYWWLRSPRNLSGRAGFVYPHGYVSFDSVTNTHSARPAFNLDRRAILFTSAAQNGKSQEEMDSGLAAVPEYNGSEWKLTLLDGSRTFSVKEEARAARDVTPGETVAVPYTGAETGENEYISALLVDEAGRVLYYGRICSAGDSADGTADITIPADMAEGAYTLKLFNEQYNGDCKTDYASAFSEIALTVVQKYDITIKTEGEGTVSASAVLALEGKQIELRATPQVGSHFKGWQVTAGNAVLADASAAESSFAMPAADVTITAVFEAHALTHVKEKTATCTEAGNTEHWYCTVCEGYFSDAAGTASIPQADTVLAATGHTLTHTAAKAATHTEDGNIAYWHCTECNGYFRDEQARQTLTREETVVKAEGHTLIHVEAKAAACTEAGNTEYWYCTVCEGYFSDAAGTASIPRADTVLAATGHTLTHTAAKAATCTEDGNIAYWHCAECGGYFRDEQARQTLTREETVVKAEGHTLIHVKEKTATCTEAGNTEHWYCTVCEGYFSDAAGTVSIPQADTVLAATGHTLTHTAAKAATCTEEGNIAYWYCAECGRYFADAAAFQEIALADTVVEKLPHSYDLTTWKWDETSHWHECACGAVTDLAAHTPGPAATETTPQTCTACGKVLAPALGHTHSYTTDWTSNAAGHWHACVCGEKSGEAPHDFGAWVVLQPATEAADGLRQKTCRTCGYTVTEAFPADDPEPEVPEEPDAPEEPEVPVDPEEPAYEDQYDLDIVEGITDVPDGLLGTEFDTTEKIEGALLHDLIVSEEYKEENTILYDVTLKFSTDGGKSRTVATRENFPQGGILVRLDYPAGTSRATHSFVVSHMRTEPYDGKPAGYIERPELTLTEDHITFVAHSLSPIGLAWTEKAAEPEQPAKPAQVDDTGDTEAFIGAAVVIGGGAALLAYHYREALPIWKLGGVVVLAADTPAAAAGMPEAASLAGGAAATTTPVADAVVTLYQNGEAVKTLLTDANGCFAARLPKGTYEAVVTWEREGVVYTARRELTAESLLTGRDAILQQIVLRDTE